MAALLQWGQQNPGKAALLSMLGSIIAYKNRFILQTPKSLKNKVIVITGGACGLGKAIALKCFAEGSIVIIWDVNKTAIKECNAFNNANSNHPNGGKLCAKYVDVTNKSMVDEEAKCILNEFGFIDILIQNAGVVAGRKLFDLSEKDVRRTFDVNVISQFWTLSAFLPSMIERKSGHIVSIVSVVAFVGCSHLTDYAASKAAARSLDQSVKRELMDLNMDNGIVFTGIYPGFMNTGMFAGAHYKNYFGSTLFTGKEMLSEQYVVDKTMDAIKYEKREVLLPHMMEYPAYLGPLLMHSLQDKLAVYSNDMKTFIGGKNRLSKL